MTAVHDRATFFAGDTWPIVGECRDENGAALDVTGATIAWALKNQAGATVLTLGVGSGITITDGPNGLISIAVPAAQTAAISAGTYLDQLRVTTPDGVVSTQWIGSIEVKASYFA